MVESRLLGISCNLWLDPHDIALVGVQDINIRATPVKWELAVCSQQHCKVKHTAVIAELV